MARSKITVTDRGEGVKNATVATLRERNPALAARLAGNVFGGGDRKIPLKEKHDWEGGRWHIFISNEDVPQASALEMKRLGYVPVVADDLDCPVNESGFTLTPDGYLARGPHNKEMLWKMEGDDFKLVQAEKTRRNNAGTGSRDKIKNDMANAAGASLGDEAGSFIQGLEGQVIDRITGGDAA